jgi:leucine zipper transcription factor-like protein 1
MTDDGYQSDKPGSLNDHHQDQVVTYLRFVRLKRFQFLKELGLAFEEVTERRYAFTTHPLVHLFIVPRADMDSLWGCRVNETTFTATEVSAILKELESLIRSDVEHDLINLSHTNILLLQQYYTQAEQWHLKLTSNIAQLENKWVHDVIVCWTHKMERSGGMMNSPL